MPTVKEVGRPAWMPERKPHERRVRPNSDVYNKHDYRKRVTLHKMQNPLCVECLKEGIRKAVEVTDHVRPINQGGAVDDPANWQSLCHYHHNIKSGREAHEGRGGSKT